MNNWSSVIDGLNGARDQLTNGATWLWNNTSMYAIPERLGAFTANTLCYMGEQGLALRKAIPNLFYSEKTQKVVGGMAYMVAYDVAPLVVLNVAYSGVQHYCRVGHEQDRSLTAYSAFLSVLTVGGYLLKAYTWRQGAQSLIRMGALESLAVPAFNANKKIPPLSPCKELECDTQRIVKGMGRELFILTANQLLIGGISYTPYVGYPLSTLLRVINNGRYITRVVTPERCERHKAMVQESVLALGITYELSSLLMNQLLSETIGLPPHLYHKVLLHLLLLLHVNVAAHSPIPIADEHNPTLPFDVFNAYEWSCRFMLDVVFSGLIQRIPIDFKLPEGQEPLITLPKALNYGIQLFNRDLESAYRTDKNTKGMRSLYKLLLPPLLQSPDQFVKDPIIAMFWTDLQKDAITAINITKSYLEFKPLKTSMALAPAATSFYINHRYGLSNRLSEYFMILGKEPDFKNLLDAIKFWLQRHGATESKVNVVTSSYSLRLDSAPKKRPPNTLRPVANPDNVTTQFTKLTKEGLLAIPSGRLTVKPISSPEQFLSSLPAPIEENKEQLPQEKKPDNHPDCIEDYVKVERPEPPPVAEEHQEQVPVRAPISLAKNEHTLFSIYKRKPTSSSTVISSELLNSEDLKPASKASIKS